MTITVFRCGKIAELLYSQSTMTVISSILQQVHQQPDAKAITLGGETWTYGELYQRAMAVAGQIQQLDISQKSVGLFTDNRLEMYAGLLGIWLSGNAYVPINHKFPTERLSKIITERQIEYVLCASSNVSSVIELVPQLIPVAYDFVQENAFAKKDFTLAYTLFTSGSTGIPKGIPINHSHLYALMQDLLERYPLGQGNKVLQAFELSFDVSIACVLLAWTQGAELVVADLNGITAINAFKAIHDYQVDFVTLPPSALFYLRRLKMLKMTQPWVTKTLFTGEALPYSVVQEWMTCAVNTTVDNAYGPTEGTVWSMIDHIDGSIEKQLKNGLCPIGQPLKTIAMRIVDDQGSEVEEGVQGELWIGGPQIFHGYLGQPEKTAEVLFQDDNEAFWYKTGDVVFKNNYGKVMYVNRKDNQVQVNGYRVELGEVEHHLRNCLGHDAAVVLAHQEQEVTALYAFVEGQGAEDKVLETMRSLVPGYMLPRKIYFLAQLPVNTSGKIDKQTLRKNYLT